jgi:peptidoglycan-associated lipoprotein
MMKVPSLVVFVLAACACSGEKESRVPRAPVAPSSVAPIDTKSPTRSVVTIAEDIRKACGINDTEAHFAFDSARVSASEHPTFDRLVGCFKTGPLANREMRLVGHADPRGTEEYNMVLAGSRADNVRAALVDRGLPGPRATTTSRGEMDAMGKDEPSWAQDRRVDIRLAN